MMCRRGRTGGRADDDPPLDRTTATDGYDDLDDDGFGGTDLLPFPEDAIDQLGFANPYGSCARLELPPPLVLRPRTYVDHPDDCDDLRDDVAPDATERCNGIDDDCDPLVAAADLDVDLSTSPTW